MRAFRDTTENPVSRECLLDHLDPRLKLLLLLMLVITTFSARGFAPLGLLGALVFGLLCWQPVAFRKFLRQLSFARWLLLFTLLLHLFLTPGRTMFGLSFLSYDGLMRGLMVDTQLLLAFFFTMFFAMFTAPEAVAWAFTKVLEPLKFLGFPVEKMGGLLILVLYFLPRVYEQGIPFAERGPARRRVGFTERMQGFTRSLGGAILALVEQADDLAQRMTKGESPVVVDNEVFSWRLRDSVGLSLGILLVAACWAL